MSNETSNRIEDESETKGAGEAESAAFKFVATCDQEVWVMDRIRDTINMAIAMREQSRVQANEFALRYGMQGLIEGAAIEIIRTLGGTAEFTNIRDPFNGVPDGKASKCFHFGLKLNG